MNGHCRFVELLLEMGSDINAQIETNRNTALTLACLQGRHKVVSLLLDRKANVEHRAQTGKRKRIQISLAARVIYLIFSALVYNVHTTHQKLKKSRQDRLFRHITSSQ